MTEAAESGPDGPRPGGGSVELVGTAHVSADSVEEVERTIEERRPDVVAVELDEDRFRQLKGEAPEDLEPGDLIGGNTVFQFLAYWMLSYVQTRLGKKFDIEPGADMLAAVETAEGFGIDVALVDRDIQTTIQRFWRRMTLIEKLKMVGSLLLGTIGLQFGESEVDDLEMEDLTDADVVTVLLEEFRAFSPGGAEALIDERDAYIAHNLVALREQGYDVVAVIGAGHEPGIRNYLEHPEQLPPMESLVGQASGRGIPWFKIIGWVASIGFLSFFVLLALGVQDNWLVVQVLALWFVVNGIFAAGLVRRLRRTALHERQRLGHREDERDHRRRGEPDSGGFRPATGGAPLQARRHRRHDQRRQHHRQRPVRDRRRPVARRRGRRRR